MTVTRQFVADFSLALINRTGAYHVCRDIVHGVPEAFSSVRYWRLRLNNEPHGLVRRALGRAMVMELMRRRGARTVGAKNGAAGQPTLFMDPLYVLCGGIARDDIVICHDVGPLTHRAFFDADVVRAYERAYGMIAAAKPGMVFVSETSRAAFSGLFGRDFRYLDVIPLYVREAVLGCDAVPVAGVRDRFLLTVAATESRKNLELAIEAYAASGLNERGVGYVLCGPRGNAEDRVAALAKTAPGVTKLGFVSDAELAWLYGTASGFVLPSLLEGFGVPALEALQRGLVPLVSEDGALAEAAGDAAVVVDARDVTALCNGMLRLVDMSDSERAQRVGWGALHAATYSYDAYIARWTDRLARG